MPNHKNLYTFDLPDTPRPGVMLYCPHCRGEWSATRGDYFMRDPGTPFTCGECGEPLRLVEKFTGHREVKEHRR